MADQKIILVTHRTDWIIVGVGLPAGWAARDRGGGLVPPETLAVAIEIETWTPFEVRQVQARLVFVLVVAACALLPATWGGGHASHPP